MSDRNAVGSGGLKSKGFGRQHALDRVRELALSLEPNTKLPTKIEMSVTLGTSKATVEEALQRLEDESIIYRRRGSGIYVAPNAHFRNIRILLSPLAMSEAASSPFWGILWSLLAVESQARSTALRESHVIQLAPALPTPGPFMSADERIIAMAATRQFRSGRADGVIGIGVEQAAAEWLYGRKLPYVAFAAYADHAIGLDGDYGLELAMEELRRQGSKRIDVWPYPQIGDPSADAYDAEMRPKIVGACGRHGLELWHGSYWSSNPAPEIVARLASAMRENRQEAGYRMASAIYADTCDPSGALGPPDGIYVTEDMVTDGVMRGLQERVLQIWPEPRIVTHANSRSPVLFRDRGRITCIEYDVAAIVRALFNLLDRLMGGDAVEPGFERVRPSLSQRSRS